MNNTGTLSCCQYRILLPEQKRSIFAQASLAGHRGESCSQLPVLLLSKCAANLENGIAMDHGVPPCCSYRPGGFMWFSHYRPATWLLPISGEWAIAVGRLDPVGGKTAPCFSPRFRRNWNGVIQLRGLNMGLLEVPLCRSHNLFLGKIITYSHSGYLGGRTYMVIPPRSQSLFPTPPVVIYVLLSKEICTALHHSGSSHISSIDLLLPSPTRGHLSRRAAFRAIPHCHLSSSVGALTFTVRWTPSYPGTWERTCGWSANWRSHVDAKAAGYFVVISWVSYPHVPTTRLVTTETAKATYRIVINNL